MLGSLMSFIGGEPRGDAEARGEGGGGGKGGVPVIPGSPGGFLLWFLGGDGKKEIAGAMRNGRTPRTIPWWTKAWRGPFVNRA